MSTEAISSRLAHALGEAADPNDIDTQLNELVRQFIRDARAIDPSILRGYVVNDLTIDGRDARGAVAMIGFDRKGETLKWGAQA